MSQVTTDAAVGRWEGNWRELRHFYVRARAMSESRPGSKSISREDVEFSSSWVLLQSKSPEAGQDAGGQVTNLPSTELTTGSVMNLQAELRLDCVIALGHAVKKCKTLQLDLATCTGEVLKRCLPIGSFEELGIINEAIDRVSNYDRLEQALKLCANSGRPVRDAVEILHGATGFSEWIKKHANEVTGVVRARPQKYNHIIPLLRKLSSSLSTL